MVQLYYHGIVWHGNSDIISLKIIVFYNYVYKSALFRLSDQRLYVGSPLKKTQTHEMSLWKTSLEKSS